MRKKPVSLILIGSAIATATVIAGAQVRQMRVSEASSPPAPQPATLAKPPQPQPLRLPNLTDLFPRPTVKELPALDAQLSPVTLPEDDWRLKIPSQSEIIYNHDRLMQGTVTPGRQRIAPVAPSPFIPPATPSERSATPETPPTDPEVLPSPEPTAEAVPKPSTNPDANLAGSRPRLDTQPATLNQQSFQPELVPQQPIPGSGDTQISPSVSVITPTGYGKSWRNASVSLGLQARSRFTNQADGGLGIGLGLGNAKKTVGLDVTVSVLDLIGDTAQDGSISFKLHRQLPQDFAVAVGIKNGIRWGMTDGGSSIYGVATKLIQLRPDPHEPLSRLYLSAGVGGGQFRSEADIEHHRHTVGVFGSAALQVAPFMNAIAEWTGQDLTLGASLVPFRHLPLVITPAITDVTGRAGDGTRFILGLGYGISF